MNTSKVTKVRLGSSRIFLIEIKNRSIKQERYRKKIAQF